MFKSVDRYTHKQFLNTLQQTSETLKNSLKKGYTGEFRDSTAGKGHLPYI